MTKENNDDDNNHQPRSSGNNAGEGGMLLALEVDHWVSNYHDYYSISIKHFSYSS